MALLIQTPLTTKEGITVEGAYGRVAVINNIDGTKIDFATNLYISEAAFEAGAQAFFPEFMILGGSQEYDYSTDSKDILDLAHDAMIQVLAGQGVAAVKSL